MKILIVFLISNSLFSTDLDSYKWFLNPSDQKISIDTSDLTKEDIVASSSLDFGYSELKNYSLKKEVRVAIIDSGVDLKHSDLSGSLLYNDEACEEGRVFKTLPEDNKKIIHDCLGWNFAKFSNLVEDEDGHGTHVAGIIKNFFNFHQAKLKILPLKVFTQEKQDRPLPKKIYEAFNYAIEKKVDLIHLSMGWPESLMSEKIRGIINKALDANIAIVAAAGNSSQRANIYPCKISGVICVGALRANGKLASFSNYGPQVDFMAPGEKILSSIPMYLDPQYIPIKGFDYKNGTSQAAPFVSGAYLFLKAYNPSWSRVDIYARLLRSANKSHYSLRGMFNIPEAIESNSGIIIPTIKSLNTVNIGVENEISIPLLNHFNVNKEVEVTLNCFGSKTKRRLSLKKRATKYFKASFLPRVASSSCSLNVGEDEYRFNLKALSLPLFTEELVIEKEKVIRPVRNKVLSSLVTVPSLPGKHLEAFYYKRVRDNSLHLFNQNIYLGEFKYKENCKRLRIWQADLNKDDERDFLIEYLCDEKSIDYVFVDQSLNELFPATNFVPSLAIINYNDFQVKTFTSKRPEFLFITEGFNNENKDPWSDSAQKGVNLYKLKVIGDKYSEEILNKSDDYQKALNLRVKPDIVILNLLDEKTLIISANKIRYFVDLNTHKMTKAPFEGILFGGDRVGNLYNTQKKILNNLLTPYEYTSTLMSGLTLNYSHPVVTDPILNIFAVEKKDFGYRSYLKTFNNLIVLNFDELGHFLDKTTTPISRFDFLNGEQLEATIHYIMSKDGLNLIVDGTKIHTNYIDIIGKSNISLDLGKTCVSQAPVVLKGSPFLPLACFESGKQLLKMVKI